MLGRKTYSKAYIEACRNRVKGNLLAYRKQARMTRGAFETRYFNDQVLLLDYLFVHRLMGIEGRDGNPRRALTGTRDGPLRERGDVVRWM